MYPRQRRRIAILATPGQLLSCILCFAAWLPDEGCAVPLGYTGGISSHVSCAEVEERVVHLQTTHGAFLGVTWERRLTLDEESSVAHTRFLVREWRGLQVHTHKKNDVYM